MREEISKGKEAEAILQDEDETEEEEDFPHTHRIHKSICIGITD
jgi:hypothetical protein